MWEMKKFKKILNKFDEILLCFGISIYELMDDCKGICLDHK